MLDVDYHHGNGTQTYFYERSDVFTASIHGDPRTEYPFILGCADVLYVNRLVNPSGGITNPHMTRGLPQHYLHQPIGQR